jgi:hypothetical protein
MFNLNACFNVESNPRQFTTQSGVMRKNFEAMRCHRTYLRAKTALRDQHQDAYVLMLERHAQELDTLWADYNLAVKKLAEEHNRAVKSRILAIKKAAKKAAAQKSEEKSRLQKTADTSFKVLPMKKRVKMELNVAEERGGQDNEIHDVAPVSDSAPERNAILPKFFGFMRL